MKVMKFLLCCLLLALPVFAEESEDRQTATSLHYVSHELDTRQDKLSTGTNAALTYTNAAGGVQQRTVKENLNGGTTDTSLPQVNAVNAGLNQKQNDIAPIDDHTAVTYTEDVGTIGQKGIYQDTGTYAAQSDNLIDAKTFNAALKNALDSEFVCADRPDAHDPNTNLCWLWEIHNTTSNHTINLFDIMRVPTVKYSTGCSIVNNNDGTITVTTCSTSSAVESGKTLSYLAPELQVGHTYTLRFSRTVGGGENYIYLRGVNTIWQNGATKTITQDMLDSKILFYANGLNTTSVISKFQIEEGTQATPYQPYNLYIPQNQQ